MEKPNNIFVTASIFLTIALTFSCSNDSNGSSEELSGSILSSSSIEELSSSSSEKSSSSSVEQSSSSIAETNNTFTDERDNKVYKLVEIGMQTWMAENLNYDVSGSVCYNNLESNCLAYGRLYTWATAMDLDKSCNLNVCLDQVQSKHRGICPEGWHIPSDSDWDALITTVGDNSGSHLKAQFGWSNCSSSGSSYMCSDTYGFSALPGGHGLFDGKTETIERYGYWWGSDEYDDDDAYNRHMTYASDGVSRSLNYKTNLFSVRCILEM